MNLGTTDPARAALAALAIVAALASFAVTEGATILRSPADLSPNVVFGVLMTLLVIVIALGFLLGTLQPIDEGVTFTHLAVGIVWAVYLLAGLAFISVGYTGWIVISHLIVGVGGGVAFWWLQRHHES